MIYLHNYFITQKIQKNIWHFYLGGTLFLRGGVTSLRSNRYTDWYFYLKLRAIPYFSTAGVDDLKIGAVVA
jgi:hypothetical protein